MGAALCAKKKMNPEDEWVDVPDDDFDKFAKKIIGKMNADLVGLGNPGSKYAMTRHNVGHMFIDFLAEKLGKTYTDSPFGRYFETDDAVFIRCPKMMNISGGIVKPLKKFFKVEAEMIRYQM